MRIRGGVQYDGDTQRWRPVVHIWKDDAGLGDPDDAYQWAETYATEAEAEQAYVEHARPAVIAMFDAIGRTPGARVEINRWGWQDRPRGGTA